MISLSDTDVLVSLVCCSEGEMKVMNENNDSNVTQVMVRSNHYIFVEWVMFPTPRKITRKSAVLGVCPGWDSGIRRQLCNRRGNIEALDIVRQKLPCAIRSFPEHRTLLLTPEENSPAIVTVQLDSPLIKNRRTDIFGAFFNKEYVK